MYILDNLLHVTLTLGVEPRIFNSFSPKSGDRIKQFWGDDDTKGIGVH